MHAVCVVGRQNKVSLCRSVFFEWRFFRKASFVYISEKPGQYVWKSNERRYLANKINYIFTYFNTEYDTISFKL